MATNASPVPIDTENEPQPHPDASLLVGRISRIYLALVKWGGQMFAIAAYDAAERLFQVLS